MTTSMTLSSQFPHLAKEWHSSKNGGKTLDQFTVGSKKKAWWQCEHGHEWEAVIQTRIKGAKCPYCSNRKVLKGYNDLATTYPELAKEFHPTKNGGLTPDQVMAGTSKKFWWQCEKGHEWETSIRLRAKQGTGCPYCANFKVWVGYNDLATTDPELSKYWHPTLNHPLTPQMVTRGSGKKVWWQCRNGHEWRREVYIQTNEEWSHWYGCPICSDNPTRGEKLRPKPTRQTLFETHPHLVEELHPTKNEDLHLPSIGSTSKQKVWWLGKCGHEWESSVKTRTRGKADCPYCANQKLLRGFNDLATTNPHLVSEWHPTKNGDLTPEMVILGFSQLAWWQGECGHEWEATVFSRIKGAKCPYCSNREVLVGFNDLATTHPQLVAEWHPTKNEKLTPHDIIAGSNKKVWWQCDHGHEWETMVLVRTRFESNCPICQPKKRS